MEGPITERQLRLLNILLTENLGAENRKTYLKMFYKVDSSKELSKVEAHEIIEKFLDDNPDREENVALAMNKIYVAQGQKQMF